MAKITGAIKEGNKTFSGILIVTDMNGKVSQYPIKKGKPDEELTIKAGFYNVQFAAEESKQSSYSQYKLKVPEGESVEFDKLELEQLV